MLFKELVPIVISLALLADKLPETVFGAAVDNTGAAFAVNRLACRDKISLRLHPAAIGTISASERTYGARVTRIPLSQRTRR